MAVVGGGVVGIAVARAVARRGRGVVVLEAEAALGTHTSSRSSEVIHAGIYYASGSLKAQLCVEGKHALYAFCESHEVAFRRTGKIIVATRDADLPVLDRLAAQASASGVNDLVRLNASELAALEPAITARAGILSPSSGIVDSHGLMRALRSDGEAHGAQFALRSPVISGAVVARGICLSVGGAQPSRVVCRYVVNAAGLGAQQVARSIVELDRRTIPPCFYARGHYFVLNGHSPFRRLVYPVPEAQGLGVHVTLDLTGQARFGPDVSWSETIDYSFDASRVAAIASAIRTYYPRLQEDRLQPGYVGIRPKVVGAGAPPADFIIQGADVHGVEGLVNLYGIESPGLTAALAIAERVAAMLG